MSTLIFTIAGTGTEYRIDPATLRAVADDPTAMRLAAAGILRAGEIGNDAQDAAAGKSMAAFMLAISGDADSAESLIREALRVQTSGPMRPFVVSRLRLVQILQELGRVTDAVEEAQASLAVVRCEPDVSDLLDFALHHLGKALLEAGEADESIQVFSEALGLRREKGDEQLVRSTQMALDVAVQIRRAQHDAGHPAQAPHSRAQPDPDTEGRGVLVPEWSTVSHEFEFDGSWRDIYVHSTTLSDWKRMLNALRDAPVTVVYRREGRRTDLPSSAAREAFSEPNYSSRLLSVNFSGVTFNCHFFCESEIEFDLDPRDVTGPVQFGAVIDFMRLLATVCEMPAVLTPENIPERVIFRMYPHASKVEYIPIGDGSDAVQ